MIRAVLVMATACASTTAIAQMTLPSVFPDMKSINPAVISLRKSGMVKLSATQDTIERKQKIVELNGSAFEAEQKDDISLLNANLFKGGKGGGATSEWLIDYTTGQQKTKFTAENDQNTDYTLDTSAMYGKYAWGFGSRWGLELHYLMFQSKYEYELELNGQEEGSSIELTSSMPGIKIGKIIGSPAFSLGLTLEANMVTNKLKTSDPKVTGDDGAKFMPFVGLGLGTGGPNGLLEISVEASPISQEEDPQSKKKPPMPMKASLIAERRFGTLILGYKGMMFKGQFIDFDKMIPYQLVYRNFGDAARLEHVVNFTFAGDKGFSVGGSGSISNTKSKEKSSLFSSENTHDTETASMSLGVKLGYVW